MKSLLFIILISSMALVSCNRDNIFQGEASLNFSTDSVFFDTVFTTIGSITERLIITNPYDQTIEIEEIYLDRGQASNFKMNVDGIQGNAITDIRVEPNDSLFVFIEVTVDPNGGSNPMVIEEFLKTRVNGNEQSVSLVAWGQDAYFFPSISFSGGGLFELPTDKPVVFYGYSLVDTLTTLRIPCGANIHFHDASGLIVGHQASLKILGCVDDPVVIQGDRLEDFFNDIPGQWDQILLSATSQDNEIRNAIIKNGQIGIRVDSNVNENPSVILENTQVLNMSTFGLLAQDAKVEAMNSVFGNCGDYTVALRFGGDYSFQHCTFGNVWSESQNPRTKSTLFLNNFFEDAQGNTRVRDFNASFENTIIYGTLDEELDIALDSTDAAAYVFDHCVIKTERNPAISVAFVENILNPSPIAGVSNPLFVSPGENDYRLVENARAIDAGKDIGITKDILQTTRDAQPDIGAYEYVPEEE